VIEGESMIGRESVLLMLAEIRKREALLLLEETRRREGRLTVEETRRTEGLLLLVVGAGLLLKIVAGRLWIEIETGSATENETGKEIETGKEKDGEVTREEVELETQKTFVGHHQGVEAGAVLLFLLLLLDTEMTSLRDVTEITGEIAAEAEAGIDAIRFRLILIHVESITLHEKKNEMSVKTEATLGEELLLLLLLLIHAPQTVTGIENEIENVIENERRTSSEGSESEILKSNMNKIESKQCLPLKNVKRVILHLLFSSSNNNNNLLIITEIVPLKVREIVPLKVREIVPLKEIGRAHV
jgi:hypothetical protein